MTRSTPDLVLWDASEKSWLVHSWRLYAATFPGSIGVHTWDDVRVALREHPGRNVQLWGHGAPGRPLVAFKAPPFTTPWERCRSVWFRSCSVANGDKGREFMTYLARRTNAAAHLGIVGPWGCQSRLVGVRKGHLPWWGDSDPREPSAPWLPRTVPVWQRSLPRWTWNPYVLEAP